MSLETKLMIVTALFVLEWIYVCFFQGASKRNKEYDEQMEKLEMKGRENNESE